MLHAHKNFILRGQIRVPLLHRFFSCSGKLKVKHMEDGLPSVHTVNQIKTEDEFISALYFNHQDEKNFIHGCIKTEHDNLLRLKTEVKYLDIQPPQNKSEDVFSFIHSHGENKEFLELGLQMKKDVFDNFPSGLIPPIEMEEEEEEFEMALENKSVDKPECKKNCVSKQCKTRKSSKTNADASTRAAKHVTPTQKNSKSCKSRTSPEKTDEVRNTNKLQKEDLFSCETCGKTFHQSALLTDHIKIHRRQKPYTCDQCEMKFAKPSYLKTHLRRHAGDRPVSCDLCEKSFFDIYDLRVHQRDHTGERPFLCSECGKGFKRIYILNKHRKTHSKEKPFQCSVCGKAYKYGYSYRLHMKDHVD